MNSIAVLIVVIATVAAQRPGYLAGPTHIQLASRFKTDGDETTTVGLNNRLGENGGTTEKLPVDARGDSELVHRLQTWPRENIPFWLLNAEQIEKHRNPQGNQQVSQGQGVQNRFASQQNSVQDKLYDPYQNERFWYDYYYRPRPWFNSYESDDDTITRTIRPIATRGSFAGPLPL